MLTKRILVLVAALGLGACALEKQATPSPAGPSEFALSLTVAAVPDLITQDGASQSIVAVMARDAAGEPVRGLSIRVDTLVNGVAADFGTLSTRTISTGNDGRAILTYWAPPPPPLTAGADNFVTIVVTPLGTNYASTSPRTTVIRLVRPGVILPPNGTPTASFFSSPTQPHENETVQFDASASADDGQIVSYAWNFGDGTSGSNVKTSHVYPVAGVYNVILTVKDDRGLSASTAPAAVTVVAALDPVASFTLSPTDPIVEDMIYFDASASTVPAGRSIVSYSWNFGDGSIGAGQTTSHKYGGKPNTYTIVLTVIDSTGRKGVASKTVQVK